MNTILLGNLIKIRWIAIFGQFFAIFFVSFIINIQIPFFDKGNKVPDVEAPLVFIV